MDCMIYFIEAKYHLSVAERLIKNYDEYPSKRFLIGAIGESAKAVLKLIQAFSTSEKISEYNYNNFFFKVAPKHIDKTTRINLMKVLEIEKAQKKSPIEFLKEQKIILLIDGKYRFLTINRIKDFVKSTRNAISIFSKYFRQI